MRICSSQPFSSVKNNYLKHLHLFHILLLIGSIIIIYWPVYQFQFLIGWDDQWFVTNHYTANGLTWRNIYSIITHFYYGQYAPLNQLYYTFLYSLFEYNPLYYHVAGVCIHLANVILIYFLINTIGKQLMDKPMLIIRQISFLTALLFAILPLNLEPVSWVGASKVTLYVLFYLIALTCYCKYLVSKKAVYLYLTVLSFILSFGAKEQAVLLPLCLVLFDYVFKRDFAKKIVWLEKLPFFILALLFSIITMQSQAFYGEKVFYPLYQRVPLSFFTLTEYFTKCIIPVNLSYLYPFPFQIGQPTPWWLWIYVIAIPIILFCFYRQLKARWLHFGLLFFFIHIVLVINLFSLARYSFIADRYAYLAGMGLCFMVSYIIVNNWHKPRFKIFFLVTGILYIGILVTYSFSHIMVWENAYTLKKRLKSTIERREDFDQLKRLK